MAALDKRRGRADDGPMSTSPDKDYVDAKSEAVSASVSGEIKAFRAEVNARFAEVNGRFTEVDARFVEVNGRIDLVNARIDMVVLRLDSQEKLLQLGQKLLQEEFKARFAQLEVTFQRAHNETLKWTMGVVFAGLALSVSVPSLILRNAVANAGAPASAVIAPQTAPQTAPPTAPAKLAPPPSPH